jgi:hypothetical protein
MDTIVFLTVYVLSAAFWFHVWARSDLTKVPREWVMRVAPGWLRYMVTCPLCLTFHAGWVMTAGYWLITDILIFSPAILFAAPLAVLMVDLVLCALIRANEPPVLTVTSGRYTTSAIFGTTTVTGDSGRNGPLHGDMVSFNPLSHEQTK